MNRNEIIEQLHAAQSTRCRARTLTENEAWEAAKELAAALIDAPNGTDIVGPLWSRLPNAYQYPADGTTLHARRDKDGNISVRVIRTNDAFGNRTWIASSEGHIVRGEGVHASTGSADQIHDLEWGKRPDGK